MLAASCLTEFEDIFLLAGNGRGVGAMKLLRAFYERTVTLSYLAKKPEKVQQFIEYSDVHWHKLLSEAMENHATPSISQSEMEGIKSNFERVRGKYQKEKCRTCKTTELQASWTKLPVPQMASQVSEILRSLAFNAYLRTTFHIHTTFFGIVEQSAQSAKGKLRFADLNKQRELASEAMEIAHILIVHVMQAVNDSFKLGRDDQIGQIAEEWKRSWQEVNARTAETEPSLGPQSPPAGG
jgi:hypothetical protein